MYKQAPLNTDPLPTIMDHIRRRLDLSQKELAALAGVSSASASNAECSRYGMRPYVRRILALDLLTNDERDALAARPSLRAHSCHRQR